MNLGANHMPSALVQESDGAELARIQNHWTPRIIETGATYVAGFQLAYLYFAYSTLSHAVLYLHLLNLLVPLGGFLTCRLPLGRIYARAISFWGLTVIMVSMLTLSIMTSENDWFYVALGLMSLGASAMMPWEIPW